MDLNLHTSPGGWSMSGIFLSPAIPFYFTQIPFQTITAKLNVLRFLNFSQGCYRHKHLPQYLYASVIASPCIPDT